MNKIVLFIPNNAGEENMNKEQVNNSTHPIALRVDTETLLPWMSEDERKANVMLLDFDVDRENENSLRLDLNVVFNPLSIRRGVITKVDYYIGSTGAEISIKATSGIVQKWTEGATLDVQYTNVTKRQRKVGLSIAPIAKSKSVTNVDKVLPLTISREATDERSFTASFSGEERLLTPLQMNDTIKWTIAIPHGQKVIRDFIAGNLYLFAKCQWATASKAGCITIRPSNILFFDAKRQELSPLKSLLMRYILWKNGFNIENPDGFEIGFEEI